LSAATSARWFVRRLACSVSRSTGNAMKITVKVAANARREQVRRVRVGYYKASVMAPPVGGKANEALLRLLARHFSVRLAQVRIVFGRTSKEKMVEIVGK
jgi:uncharacterized protein